MKFIKHRVADPRIHRLTQKWLKAGVSEDGLKSSAPNWATTNPRGTVPNAAR